jgi:5-methylcytosine-specific restriction endonuclease McrA
MIQIAKYSVAEILPFIGLGKPKIQLEGFLIKAGGARLECLRQNQTCVACKRRGTIFVLERHSAGPPRGIHCYVDNCDWCCYRKQAQQSNGEKPHLNLYHVNRVGGLLLMTQDHIMPKMHGGSDSIDNLQTLCRECNTHKGSTIPKELRV